MPQLKIDDSLVKDGIVSKEQLQTLRLPSVSQHIRPLTERVPTPETKSERLIDIEKPTGKTIDSLMHLELPAGVGIEVKM